MNTLAARCIAWTLIVLSVLCGAGCATTGGVGESEPEVAPEEPVYEAPLPAPEPAPVAEASDEGTEEVPLQVAETEDDGLEEVVVGAERGRHHVIRDLVSEAQTMLRDVELEYYFTGKGKRETLRGRPVVFALWSEARHEWIMARIEISPPPVKWRPGRNFPFRLLTPGVKARHVKGTGAERLMFSFTGNDGEALKVYGRKFPVFDNALLRKKRWREVAATARPIVYLPFTQDTLDPQFVADGRELLLATAQDALDELREARAPSVAYPGQLLADVVPPELISTLAVIEQTDDNDYFSKGIVAFDEVLSHYGLKREEAYRYSVSSASALGPMQFTNRRGNGTYAMVVRRCREARIDPDFERGATDLLNAMKAAICLFDIELSQMRPEIREAYAADPGVHGIFPVAAYNGGPRNVTRLYRALTRMKVRLADLRRPGEFPAGRQVKCPCIWKQDGLDVRPLPLPRYNNENRWYVEKYQSILRLFE